MFWVELLVRLMKFKHYAKDGWN